MHIYGNKGDSGANPPRHEGRSLPEPPRSLPGAGMCMHIYDIFTIQEHDVYLIRIFTIYYTTCVFLYFYDTLYENEASAMLRQALVCIFTIYSTPRTSFY